MSDYCTFVLELEQLGRIQVTIAIEITLCVLSFKDIYLGVFKGLIFLDSHLSAAYSHGIKTYTL